MPVAPEGWNPIVLERVNLSFEDRPALKSDSPIGINKDLLVHDTKY